jgi:hypothetical protein
VHGKQPAVNDRAWPISTEGCRTIRPMKKLGTITVAVNMLALAARMLKGLAI